VLKFCSLCHPTCPLVNCVRHNTYQKWTFFMPKFCSLCHITSPSTVCGLAIPSRGQWRADHDGGEDEVRSRPDSIDCDRIICSKCSHWFVPRLRASSPTSTVCTTNKATPVDTGSKTAAANEKCDFGTFFLYDNFIKPIFSPGQWYYSVVGYHSRF